MRLALPVTSRSSTASPGHDTATTHVDLRDHRAVQREDALDADAVGHLAHRERLAHAAALLRDADAFEGLHALLLAFLHADIHANGVTGPERRDVVAQPLFLRFDERMHF